MMKKASTDLDGDLEEQGGKFKSSQTFVRLMALILRHQGPMLLGILMILLGTSATLLEPRIFGYAIDEGILPRNSSRLRTIGILFFSVTCLRILSVMAQGYLFELLGQRVTHDLRMMLFSHLQRLSVPVFDKNPAGRLLTRVTNDIAGINEMFSAGFLSMVCNGLLVIGILTWLLLLDVKLGLIASSVFPLMVLISAYFSKKLKVAYRDARNKLSALNSFLAENLSGMKIIHLFNRQELHLGRFDRLNQRYADAQVGSIRVFALFQPTITVSAGISLALVIWFGGVEATQEKIKIGVLVAYFSYVLSLFQPVREIADKWNLFLSGMASAERIFSILDWETEYRPEQVNHPGEVIEKLQGHIVFENVWFAYEGENWILKDFSFEILPGQKIGVVGHTGAGKTTLMSLLMRLYEPQKGRVLLDGKELKTYDKRALRSSIGLIQQEVFLFSGTFEENITFWKKTPPGKIDQILAQMGFQKKENTLLQERGSNFSVGERQVIAFARAMIQDPQIWMLDEATANMDSETEGMIQRSLCQVSRNKTSLLIAHRLDTVKDADRILVLHKGNLAEQGTHEELLAKQGLYAKLFQYQSVSSV